MSRLVNIRAAIKSEGEKHLNDVAERAVVIMQRIIPVDTGLLRSSVHYEKEGTDRLIGHDPDIAKSISESFDYGGYIYTHPSLGHKNWIEGTAQELERI